MDVAQQQKFFLIISILMIYVAATIIQGHLFLNWDVSFLINKSRLFIEGGSYKKDFFTPSPPLIFYLYAVPLIIDQLFINHIFITFCVYIFFLASISLYFCYQFVKKIFSAKDFLIVYIFIMTLTALFIILPLYEFGQRDHLLVILSMPYFLATAYRLQGGNIKPRYAVMIGLFAGIGFAIKPHFLITPLLIEIYFIFYNKRLFSLMRPEALVMGGIFITYGMLIIIFYHDFILNIIPFLTKYYYISMRRPWKMVLFNQITLFCFFPLLFFIFQYKKNEYKKLSCILFLAWVGFLFSYISQRNTLYYHMLPVFSISILLLMLFFSFFVLRPNKNIQDYILMTLPALFVFTFLFFKVSILWTFIIFHPLCFFSSFFILFSILFYAEQQNKKFYTALVASALIISIGFWVSFLIEHTSWFSYQFLETVFVLISLFGVFASKINKRFEGHVFTTLLGALIFSFPVYSSCIHYNYGLTYKDKVLSKLVRFIHTQAPHQSIYVFSIMGNYSHPLVDYTDVISRQRFDCFWMTIGLSNQIFLHRNDLMYEKDKNVLIDMIAEDFYQYKPDLVFVDIRKYVYYKDVNFDYITFFSGNEKFRDQWKHYRYLTTLQEGGMYYLRIYKRT